MSHTCMLVGDGRVQCWGEGSQGQLGHGSLHDSSAPAAVLGIDDAVALEVAPHHSCVLRRGGGVACWGANVSAQLGDGTTDSRHTPVEVIDIDDAVDVAVHSQGTCALRRGGEVACWGRNLTSRPHYAGVQRHHTPQVIPGLAGVRSIEGAGLKVCAVRGPDDALVCFGLIHYVDGSLYDAKALLIETGVVKVEDLVLSGEHGCFARGGVWRCWGRNDKGQLGVPASREPINAKDAVGVGSGVVGALALSDEGGCVLGTSGAATCFGAVAPSKPTIPLASLSLPPYAHAQHACGLTAEGAAMCWGDNTSGKLGDGTTAARAAPTAVAAPLPPVAHPAPVTAPTGPALRAAAIAAGYDSTCALDGEGDVWCWGKNHDRVMSDPQRQTPHPARVEGLKDVVELVAGFGYHCARHGSGAVSCWGDNWRGALGDGTTTRHHAPVKVPGIDDAVQLSLGGQRCVLRASGEVWCWSGEKPARLDALLRYKGKIAQIAAGEGHTCALLESGRVLCAGHNAHGQLGNGEGGCKPDPTDVRCGRPKSRCKPREICAKSDTFEPVVGLTDAKALSLSNASCALRKGGRMSCWGDLEDHEKHYTPIEVPLTGVTDVSVSGGHICAVAEGRPYCWGENVFAVVGDRTTQNRTAPAAVYGLEQVKALSAGQSHTCALDDDGVVWCWGKNDDGLLSVGVERRRVTAPMKVRTR